MDLTKLYEEYAALQSDPELFAENHLAAREKAIDYVSFMKQIVALHRNDATLAALHQTGLALKAQLEARNAQLFTRLRTQIQRGEFTPAMLRQEFNRFTPYQPGAYGQAHIGYDGLDVLVSGLFESEPPPRASQILAPDMVHYEPTPTRAILDLVDHVAFPPGAVFYDLGSGLGQVAMLIHLLTGARVKGVEFEPVFCTYARNCAQQLGLKNVEFINADARIADYADGDLFYLFTPFKGALLQTVLDRLAQEARQRPITVCTYGPCTPQVAKQSWLRSLDQNANHEFKLAVFAGGEG
ncbi:MAG: class I SAM-dependent methyltransferase [Caldilineaceae bacterium]